MALCVWGLVLWFLLHVDFVRASWISEFGAIE